MQHPGHPQVPYYNTTIPQYPNQQPYFYSQPLASTSQRPTGPYTGPQRPVPFQSITAPQQSAPISSASTPKPPPTAEPPKSRKPPARKTYYEDKQIKVPDDAKIKEHMKKSLAALVEEDTPGAKLEDDAAELLLHMANDFLNEVTNFSFRLAEHRLGEQQQGDDKQYVVTPEDMLLCLDRIGMRVPLTEAPRSRPQVRYPPSGETSGQSYRGEPAMARTPQEPPLAQARPRRHTNPIPQEASEEEELTEEEDGDEEDEEDDSEEDGDADDPEEGQNSDDEKPRESKRLRARAEAAEKEKKTRGRGRGRGRR
ncbi:hypothetical protein FRC16_002017 [Serendipita sp. 398]|nr:hypothetical protein FRC16_002017 [Serendipita sp. 398]